MIVLRTKTFATGKKDSDLRASGRSGITDKVKCYLYEAQNRTKEPE
jgi:hypothetical protein